MAFKTLFMAHAPDADPTRHRSEIDTGMYRLFTVVVSDQAEATEIAEAFVADQEIDAILLCPGFTHRDVAELVEVTEGQVAVCVARGDGPSGRISVLLSPER